MNKTTSQKRSLVIFLTGGSLWGLCMFSLTSVWVLPGVLLTTVRRQVILIGCFKLLSVNGCFSLYVSPLWRSADLSRVYHSTCSSPHTQINERLNGSVFDYLTGHLGIDMFLLGHVQGHVQIRSQAYRGANKDIIRVEISSLLRLSLWNISFMSVPVSERGGVAHCRDQQEPSANENWRQERERALWQLINR